MPQQGAPYPKAPMVLIVTGQEWASLSMMTLFSPRGYAVLRAFTGGQALDRVRQADVDLLIIDRDLRDMEGFELSRILRDRNLVPTNTPILLTGSNPWGREDRLSALRAGAWDVFSFPMDGEELFLRLDVLVRAKLQADSARDEGLLDPETGLYNAKGLLRRAGELGAVAGRHHRPLACVVLAAEVRPAPDDPFGTAARAAEALDDSAVRALTELLQATGRSSDTIGRLSESEFVILAPDTDATGVASLTRRLESALQEYGEGTPPLAMRVGTYAVPNFTDASIAPTELLLRAADALRKERGAASHPPFLKAPLRAMN